MFFAAVVTPTGSRIANAVSFKFGTEPPIVPTIRRNGRSRRAPDDNEPGASRRHMRHRSLTDRQTEHEQRAAEHAREQPDIHPHRNKAQRSDRTSRAACPEDHAAAPRCRDRFPKEPVWRRHQLLRSEPNPQTQSANQDAWLVQALPPCGFCSDCACSKKEFS